MSERFDVIAFHDIVGADGNPQTPWKRIGGGSFGVVYSASYLGTQVAVKEVLPNDTYDVAKYFERECVLMKEARHPNIVQYIGLSRSPGADGRIYIISEFVGPNVRSFIADHRKPFPWRLRLSFATDIARALAYLHARNCLHRDLKPENLLITDNERVKMCDFGFARIAARNEEEMRRMSYCGTDGYMSPEILLGLDFSLPSDIFSLGVIFAEIASRHLVDSSTFKRSIPSFTLDPEEVHQMASEGCPERLIQLAIDCTQENPADRPDMREVLMRLRLCEQEIIAREEAEAEAKHSQFYSVGSIRGASSLAAVLGTKKKGTSSRPGGPPRLPSFQGQVQVGKSVPEIPNGEDEYGEDSEDDEKAEKEVEEALAALEKVGVAVDPSAPDLGLGIDPSRPAQLVSTIRGSKKGKVQTATAAAPGTNTFKVSGYGNPWWSDEDERQSVVSIPSSWITGSGAARAAAKAGHAADTSTSSGRQPLLGGGSAVESQYSTSVVRSSKLSAAHGHGESTPLGSRLSVLTARNGAFGAGGAISNDSSADDDESGSTITVRHRDSSSVGQHPNVDIAEMAALSGPEPLREDLNLSPVHKNTLTRHAGGGGTASAPQSFIVSHGASGTDGSGREPSIAGATISSTIYPSPVEEVPQRVGGGGLRSRLFGRSSDGPAAVEDRNSTIKGNSASVPEVEEPTALYHRFSLVKNSTRRPPHMSAAQQAAAAARGVSGGPGAGSLLPPAVMLSNALARCWVCGKRVGWKPFCECDDCPMRTHVGCSQFALPNCQELVFPPASGAGGAGGAVGGHHHYHPRAPSVQPAVYASNSGPRWAHGPLALRSASSGSNNDSSTAIGGNGKEKDNNKAGRKVSSSSSASSSSSSVSPSASPASSSTSTPRSSSRSPSSSSRSNSVDVNKPMPALPSRAAESLAACAVAAGLGRDGRGGAGAGDAAGAGRTPLGQGQVPNRPMSPLQAPASRSSSTDGKFVKMIKGGAKRISSGGNNSSAAAAAAAAGNTSPGNGAKA
ncbi:hypothetical protein CF327_g6156 [Tilletia walkeri]|nr:hypothetical protein CF327_g6156 [Tilletia walkeri]